MTTRYAKGSNQYAKYVKPEWQVKSENRLNADMSYWRRTGQSLSPAVASATIEDWLN